MRAVLLAQGYREGLEPVVNSRPSPLLCLADKPIIVHIIESLARQGITQFDIILHHLPELIEEALGTGRRWGVTITYHLTGNKEQPFSTIAPSIQQWSSPQILIGQGDLFPIVQPQLLYAPTRRSRLFYKDDGQWTGWGVLPETTIRKITSTTTEEQLAILVQRRAKKVETPLVFSTRSFDELHRDNQRFLRRQLPQGLLPTSAKMVEKDLWLSRAVTLHPTAELIPPVFIGERCQINQGVKIGPNVVIENGCLIDTNSTITDAVIREGSYVGESLDVASSIVDGHNLINLSLQTQVTIPDDHILSDLRNSSLRHFIPSLLEKMLAIVLLVLLAPLAALPLLSRRLIRKEVVTLPASQAQDRWSTWSLFSFRPKNQNRFSKLIAHLPSLLNIIKGELHFVGVTPRSKDALVSIPDHWRDILLRGKPGLFTLLDIEKTIDAETSFVTEAYYVTNRSFFGDMNIMVKKVIRWILNA